MALTNAAPYKKRYVALGYSEYLRIGEQSADLVDLTN